MTYPWRGRYRRHPVATPLLAAVAMAVSFLSPAIPEALASTTTTTAVPGSNCSAALSGVALHRTGWVASTNAPSSSADAPANALDGNYSTRFSTDEHQAPGLYFEVNMGSPQAFDEVKMAVPNSPTDYARGYDVEVSSNGSTWATVASCAGTGTPETVSFPTQTAQYVRVVLTASTVDHWWSIDEFKLFSQSAPPTTTTTTVPPTTAPPRPVVRAQTGVTRVFNRSVALRLRCANSACRGFINLWHDGIFLGRDGYALGAGATGTFIVRLDGRALGLIYRAPRHVLYANQVVLVNGGRKVRRGTLLIGSRPRPVTSALTGGPTRIFNGSVALRLRCANTACRGHINLWHDGILLGQVGFALGAGSTGTFIVRLDGRALRLIYRAPRHVLYANQAVLVNGGRKVRRGIRLIG